jgi:hypothetical protein
MTVKSSLPSLLKGNTMPTFAIKNLKTFKAHEGMPGYSCTLYIDGKKACDVFEDCGGGELQTTWFDRTLQKVLDDHCKTLPPLPKDERYPDLPQLNMDAYLFIDNLVNDLLTEREDKKMVKKFAQKLCCKLPSDKRGQYGIFNVLPTAEAKAKVKVHHPDAVFLDEHPNDWRKVIGL